MLAGFSSGVEGSYSSGAVVIQIVFQKNSKRITLGKKRNLLPNKMEMDKNTFALKMS